MLRCSIAVDVAHLLTPDSHAEGPRSSGRTWRVPSLKVKSLLPYELREATRLTKAGRLMEATAAIQRLLSPAANRGPEARPDEETATIDGRAEETKESSYLAGPDIAAAPSLLARVEIVWKEASRAG